MEEDDEGDGQVEYPFAEHVLDETVPGEELKLKLKCIAFDSIRLLRPWMKTGLFWSF